MRVVIQRVTQASVAVAPDNTNKEDNLNIPDNRTNVIGSINKGLMILVGIEQEDSSNDISWLAKKLVNLRIFDDSSGVMNLSVKDIEGEILLISQFTLHALTAKGNRPSYIRAANPTIAIPIYESFIKELEMLLGKKIQTGRFGADMKVSLVNDGPVTILIDTKNKE